MPPDRMKLFSRLKQVTALFPFRELFHLSMYQFPTFPIGTEGVDDVVWEEEEEIKKELEDLYSYKEPQSRQSSVPSQVTNTPPPRSNSLPEESPQPIQERASKKKS